MLLHQLVMCQSQYAGHCHKISYKKRWQFGLKHLQVLLWQQQADSGFKLANMFGIADAITGTHLAVLFHLPALTCMLGFIVQSEAGCDISSEPV